MNMFARFDENPAMTVQDIKETKRYQRMEPTAHTDGQRENSIPTTNKVCVGIKIFRQKNTIFFENFNLTPLDMYNGLSEVNCIKPEGRIH